MIENYLNIYLKIKQMVYSFDITIGNKLDKYSDQIQHLDYKLSKIIKLIFNYDGSNKGKIIEHILRNDILKKPLYSEISIDHTVNMSITPIK